MAKKRSSVSSPQESVALRRAAGVAAAAVFAITLLTKIGGPDIFWHLRTGEWIVRNCEIPTMDPFSHAAEGPWRYTDALAQVLYYGVSQIGGFKLLVLYHALIGGLLALLVAALTRSDAAVTVLTVGLWGMTSHAAMGIQPHIFTSVGLAGLLLLLRFVDEYDRHGVLLWIPLGMALWVNLHRGGALGLAVLGAATLVWCLTPSRRHLGARSAGVLVLAGLASLLNSGGTFYLTSSFDLVGRSSFRSLLMDWHPLTWDALERSHICLIPIGIAWLVDQVRGQRRSGFELLVVAGTGFLAWRSVRFVPLVAIALVPGCARGLAFVIHGITRRLRATGSRNTILVVVAALGLLLPLWQFWQRFPPNRWGLGVMESRVPIDLARFLREAPPPGEMWNSFGFGGYLLYALAPQQKVLIDGRNDTVYSDRLFREVIEAKHNPEILKAHVRRFGIGYLVVENSGPGDSRFDYLHGDPSWALVYWDDLGAVFVKRTPEARAYLETRAYRYLRLDTAFARADGLGRNSDDNLFAAEVLRSLEQAPNSIRAHFLAALVLRRSGAPRRYQEVRADLMRLAEERGLMIQPP